MSKIAPTPKTTSRRALAALISYYGGPLGTQRQAAKTLGVRQQYLSRWLCENRVSADGAITLEKVTGGIWSRSDFRPDLWPPDVWPRGDWQALIHEVV